MAIDLEGINLSLGRGAARVHILKDVSLHIGHAERIGLTGPSGSGKSSLLMVLAGLERPDSGRVSVLGEEFGRLDEDQLARFRGKHIGVVFQSFHLIPTMTALENVAVPLELAGAPDAFVRARDELAEVGLAERMHHYPAELVRRRAAAGGARPGAGAGRENPRRGRADRQSRRGDRRERGGSDLCQDTGTRRDACARHA